MEFRVFPKIPRLFREMIITEKIDGTNASIHVSADGLQIQFASRNRFITPIDDNFGFAMWGQQNVTELLKLGPGSHYGEWWGVGIQRGYELSERRFSLFNVSKWADPALKPKCCSIVPILYEGLFCTETIDGVLKSLSQYGSRAVPNYMKPEGIVIYHKAAGSMFKVTLEGDKKG